MTTVQELRKSKHISKVVSGEKEDRGRKNLEDYWLVYPNQSSYNTEEGVEYLTNLNVTWEYEDGVLKVPKGNITE